MLLTGYISFFFAEQDRMQDLFRAFRMEQNQERTNEALIALLILAVIALGLFFYSTVVKPRREKKIFASSRALFVSLCRAHKLKYKEIWLLWRLARAEQLSDPARLFLEPAWFEESSLPPNFRARAKQFESICNRIFAGMKENKMTNGVKLPGWNESVEPAGAALPVPGTAPKLDISPWQGSSYTLPLPPVAQSPDGAQI
jgi:hypothetical protein